MSENKCAECAHDENRKGWKQGPWNDEPDRVEFEHAGLNCLLHRNHMGVWCGYVGVPPDHKLHGCDRIDVDLQVHGGITYADHCQGAICHVPKPGEPEHLFWFGFDCGHGSDLVPMLENSEFMKILSERKYVFYKDLAYVRKETEGLAEQLASL